MARVTSANISSMFSPSQLCYSRRRHFNPSNLSIANRSSVARIRASSTAFVETKQPEDSVVVEKGNGRVNNGILACPICFHPVSWTGDQRLSVDSSRECSLQCDICKKTYSGAQTHFDLTPASGAKNFGEFMSPTTEFFRSPFISFLYERGWRQNFFWGGFPGPEKEFELMKDYLKPAFGGKIIDASCGSGMFSRIFAKSGLFSHIVALDYSESMLEQCYNFIEQEENFPKENFILVRADIGRLPFASSSVDAVHAGAAIHCWPSPSMAVAEISRVLRPGGVFVATTFILDGSFSFIPFLKTIQRSSMQIAGNYFPLSERELEDICRTCGLVGFTCYRNRGFVMFTVRKPE